MEEYREEKHTFVEERREEDAWALELAMETAQQGLFDAEERWEHAQERYWNADEALWLANAALSDAEWKLNNVNSNEEWAVAMEEYEKASV